MQRYSAKVLIFRRMTDVEELVCDGNGSEAEFDRIIGFIEEIIIDPKFSEMQHQFMEKYYNCFEECEENKLEYMDIFKAYTDLIEVYLETSLLKKLPDFSMKDFLEDLISKQSELEGEVFDILVSFTDFVSFKEMLLDYKAAKEGITPDLSIDTHSYHNGHN